MYSPRIYTYKITFEEVPYYYYGSKKEKYYNQPYMGSPVTHKWCWEFYTPKKQILEVFDYSDEGYEECRKVENRLIKPVLNDPYCLNESCGGHYSLKVRRNNGYNSLLLKKGFFSPELDEIKRNWSRKIGKILYENKQGIFALTLEEKIKYGRKGGITIRDNKIGVFNRSKEQMSKDGKMGAEVTNSKKYKCTITGFVSTSGPLTRYQRKRGIDPSNRVSLN